MPTNKPRVTFALSQGQLERLEDYRIDQRIKNQSQAILSLIEKGLSDIEKSGTAFEEPPEEKRKLDELVKKYRLLDPYGKEAVDGVLDVESRRCEEERQKQAAILREQWEQMDAAEEIAPDASEMLVYINPAAAGTPLYAESDFERLTFPADKVPRGADFGIRISGRSMEPTVMDGSIAWVRKRQEIPNEAVGIFMLNDAAVCKRFFKKDNGSVQLKSDNPDFPDVPVTEFDNFVLVGEVIGTV